MRDEVPNNVEQNGIAIDFDAEGLKAYMFFVTLADIQGDGIRRLGGWPQFDWDGDRWRFGWAIVREILFRRGGRGDVDRKSEDARRKNERVAR